MVVGEGLFPKLTANPNREHDAVSLIGHTMLSCEQQASLIEVITSAEKMYDP